MEQIDLPTDDQWMYHAVADTMLAYSFLSSLPEVDPERIGITGISWGGVVASIVAGLDERPKFIIPVYGCGYISYDFHDGTLFLNSSYPAEKIRHWRKLWDPANYLEQAKAPMFWLTGSNDFAFTLKALQLSYQQAPSPRTLCVKIGMTHGHEGPAQESREIFAFADSIITASPPLTKIVRQGAERSLAWVLYEAKSPITRAVLNYTNDQGRWQDKQWKTIPAKINEAEAKVEADIPTTAKAYFFNLIDDQGLSTSTEHVLVNPTAQ